MPSREEIHADYVKGEEAAVALIAELVENWVGIIQAQQETIARREAGCEQSKLRFKSKRSLLGMLPDKLSDRQRWCPQGDSNPRFGLERATSWTARRWGRHEKDFIMCR